MTPLETLFAAFFLCAVMVVPSHAGVSEAGRVTVFPAPAGEPASADYEVHANGKPVFCYTSFRCDSEPETTIAGRPVSPLSFCSFDGEGRVEIEVRFLDGLKKAGVNTSNVIVRPLARDVRPMVRDGCIRFSVDRPGSLTVEPGGGLKHPLHLFVNPPEKDLPDPKDPNVLYFAPGIHEVGDTQLKTGQTVYIAGGAIVFLKPRPLAEVAGGKHDAYGRDLYWAPGMFGAVGQKNLTIRDRGILCGRRALEHGQRGYLVKFERVDNLNIEGIVIRESPVWSLHACNCNNVRVCNVKVIGHYVNNDGICIGGTSNALVEDCFSHNADDSLEIKVWRPQKNVTFRNCVVWNDIGGCFGLMHECGATLENVLYENCTVIHATDDSSVCPAVGVKLSGTGSIHNLRFEKITVEDMRSKRRPALKLINNWDDWHMDLPTKPGTPYELLNPPQRAVPSGSIRDVAFRDILVMNSGNSDVALIAEGPESPIEGITFENVVINGKRLVPDDPRIKKNEWVRGVTVR